MTPSVLIVGGGLSGLCCGRELAARGIPFRILEAADAVGGRVRTDTVDGFRLDRGMQNYLDSYPEGRRVLDYTALDLRPFSRAVLVRAKGKFHRLADPKDEFITAARSAFAPVGTLRDKFAAAKLKGLSSVDPATAPDTTTEAFLRETGIGPQMLGTLFRPFFGSISLDASLATSARFFRFVYHLFAEGRATLPAAGMQAIPEQLAAGLPVGSVALNVAVASVSDTTVTLASGEVLAAKAVVLASAGPDAARLSGGVVPPVGSNGNTTLYYSADNSPMNEPILMLDGDGVGPVSACLVTSEVCPESAPAGKSLVAASVIGIPAESDGELDGRARQQLSEWFGPAVAGWKLLRVYRIPHALPSQPPGALEPWERPARLPNGLFVAGDHRTNASINGAMVSGRRAAEAVAEVCV